MSESKGVVYYNKGTKCIPRLIVSIMTLRKHYQGNVTIFLEGEHPKGLPESLQKEFNVRVVYRPSAQITTGTLVHKIEISMEDPYDLNVWLDADTLVAGSFDELFEMARDVDLVITHFAGWKSSGGTIRRRIERYREKCPDYMDAAIAYGPAINTGVYAWKKGSVFFKEWIDLAKWGDDKMFIADEVACQVLLPRYKIGVAAPKFNVSVAHDPGTQDARIIHYHGKKHCKEYPLCDLWFAAYEEALQKNLCDIRRFTARECGDKRLSRFMKGKYGTKEWRDRIKLAFGIQQNQEPQQAEQKIVCQPEERDEDHDSIDEEKALHIPVKTVHVVSNPVSDVTIVTACDTKYVGHLQATLPNWIKYKHIERYPMIVYINGFDSPKDERLSFLKVIPNLRIIPWEMPNAADQRERMLTAFVLGTARDVDTKYWMKVDADAYATNDEPLIDEKMKQYAICGHRWGYSFAKHMGPLIDWANKNPAFKHLPPDKFDKSKVSGKRYYCERTASYVQMHQSDFVRMAAGLAGDRLPVPSHDTYLWYVAWRLGLPMWRHNFKRHRGMTNKSNLDSLLIKLREVESGCMK